MWSPSRKARTIYRRNGNLFIGRVLYLGHRFERLTGPYFGGLVEEGGSTESKGTEYGFTRFLFTQPIGFSVVSLSLYR
jgi:hypothetical protein